MGNWSVAKQALYNEETYLREMAVSQASLGSAVVGITGGVPSWGPWESAKTTIDDTMQRFNETLSTAQEGLGSVADLIRSTADAYTAVEEANSVGGN